MDTYATWIHSTVEARFYSADVVLEEAALHVKADTIRTAVERVQDAMDCLRSYKTALELAAEHGGILDTPEAEAEEMEPQLREAPIPGLTRKASGVKQRLVRAASTILDGCL